MRDCSWRSSGSGGSRRKAHHHPPVAAWPLAGRAPGGKPLATFDNALKNRALSAPCQAACRALERHPSLTASCLRSQRCAAFFLQTLRTRHEWPKAADNLATKTPLKTRSGSRRSIAQSLKTMESVCELPQRNYLISLSKEMFLRSRNLATGWMAKLFSRSSAAEKMASTKC